MQPYTDVLLSTNGAIPNASVTVKTYPGGAVATVYSDNGVTTIANPLTTGNDGRFLFYAADGLYTLTISKTGINTQTIGPIQLDDYATTTPIASKLSAPTGSSLVGFIQSGTGAVARISQSKMRDIVSVKDDGATGDAVTNDGTNIGNALTDFPSALVELPFATYLTSTLTLPQAGKLSGRGSTLKPSANSMAVLSLAAGMTLQSGDFQLVRDLIVTATGKTGITGLKAVSGTNAATRLENVTVLDADTVSFDLQNSQFCRTQGLRASLGTGAGMLINNAVGTGGGNSHDHYGLHVVQKEVGVVVNGTNYAGGVHSINFYNPQCLSNSVCGMAFFDANATVYGGAPELNGAGAATVVVDGKTVKNSSMYMNNSTVRVENMHSAEPTVTPHFLLEANSILTLNNFSGYGNSNSGTLLVSADSTSGVVLEGSFNSMACVQNVLAWPDALILPATAQLIMYGVPIHNVDPSVVALYADQASAFISSTNNAPTVNAFAEDSDLGYCRSITFQAVASNFPGSTSFVRMDLSAAGGAASQDTIFSWLIKSDINCNLRMDIYNGSSFNLLNPTTINLIAGKVTRIVAGKRLLAVGTGLIRLYLGPVDTLGANIKISNLQCFQGPTGTEATTRTISKIVKHGSFYPGVTRETQTNLRLLVQSVNTMGKYPGKPVWDTTNNRIVFAAGSAVADVWKDGVTATVHTPV